MAIENGRIDEEESEHGLFIRLLLAIRGSFNLFTICLGLITVALSIFMELIQFQEGVMAALFMIWGVSAIILGVSGLLFLSWIGYR